MKKYILLLFTCLIYSSMKAQLHADVDIRQIALINPKNTMKGLLAGESSGQCIQVLGQPDNISDYYSEIDDDTMKLYKYGKNKLFFLKDKLDIWSISDDKIWVGQVNGQIFKVGDKLAPARERGANQKFLDFPITHYKNVSQNMYFYAASIMEIMNNDSATDSRVELLFNAGSTLFSISMSD